MITLPLSVIGGITEVDPEEGRDGNEIILFVKYSFYYHCFY